MHVEAADNVFIEVILCEFVLHLVHSVDDVVEGLCVVHAFVLFAFEAAAGCAGLFHEGVAHGDHLLILILELLFDLIDSFHEEVDNFFYFNVLILIVF